MRRCLELIGLLLICVLMTSATQAATFKGEIVDRDLNCIQKPMKAPQDLKNNKQACILYWVNDHQPMSKYVLYDPSSKTTYQLDNQMLAEPYAGAWVVVTGTETDNSIKMATVMTDESAYKNHTQTD